MYVLLLYHKGTVFLTETDYLTCEAPKKHFACEAHIDLH